MCSGSRWRRAKKAAEELKVDIVWKGPVKENDRAQQIQLVQQFITEGVKGIVLAPLDHQVLVGPVKEARAKVGHRGGRDRFCARRRGRD